MDTGKDKEVNKLSRRDFLKLAGRGLATLAGTEFLSACSKLGIDTRGGLSQGFYENDRGSWLVNAQDPREWRRIVGEENPHAQEGLVLVFAGGVYIPSEIQRFRTSPLIREDNSLSKNPEKGGLLIINPVLVKGATLSPEFSENSLNVPSPDGTTLEDLKDFRHMWVAMATNELVRLGFIGYDIHTRAEVATGSAVCFGNITADPLASLIPAAGEQTGLSTPYDGEGGYWRYARLVSEVPTDGSPIVYVGPDDTAVRWDGAAVICQAQGVGVARVGEIKAVSDYNEAVRLMSKVPNPLAS